MNGRWLTQVLSWLPWVEHGLALAAVMVLAAWFARWLSLYTGKQRELSRLDVEIRDSFKQLVGVERERRISETERLSERLKAAKVKLGIAAGRLENRGHAVGELATQLSVVRVANDVALTMAGERREVHLERMIEACAQGVAVLARQMRLRRRQFSEALTAAFNEESSPSPEPAAELCYHLFSQLAKGIALGDSLETAALVVPLALDALAKDPDQPMGAVMDKTATYIAGEGKREPPETMGEQYMNRLAELISGKNITWPEG